MAPAVDTAALIKKLSAPPPPGSPYGLPIPGSEKEGRSAIYRHWRARDGPLMTTLDPNIQTMHDTFEAAAQKYPNWRCLGHRAWDPATRDWENKYTWISYSEVAERRKNFGAGLVEVHRELGETREKYGVGLWSPNRPEWHITDLAAASQSLYTISLYETLGPETTEYIINHAELTTVVTSLAGRLEQAYAQMAYRIRRKGIAVWGATLTPMTGEGQAYGTPEREAARQRVNAWIRSSGVFDAVVDFDEMVRDPSAPATLAAAYDEGDHLHLNPAGYQAMADGFDLALFTAASAGTSGWRR
ncbi:hypothetical protein BN1723_012121 [Verticillium longisporum]|uniref:AMP-dependent synthetase/ligase domain-containing protein n=1 Tax=Verticillium longisporum TaxID=100787 RepID=A0A0G4LFB8_VERLO|nr:hypothetical protein BN1723_012121 [Verticillium longisporum]